VTFKAVEGFTDEERAAYAKDGNIVCSFQSAQKFNSRYATFGFSDKTTLMKEPCGR
jgi:hypothetical protein